MRPLTAAVVVLSVVALSLFATFALRSYNFHGIYGRSASGERVISPSGINVIDVDDPAGVVYVDTWNGSQVLVSYVSTSNFLGPAVPYINASGGAIDVDVTPIYPSFGYSVSLNITIPSWMAPQIYATMGAGDITVRIPSSGGVHLTTATGDVEVNVSYLPQATLGTTVGNIDLWTVRADDVQAHATTGDIYADLNGPLSGSYVFQTTTGNINIMIPVNSSVSFSLSSSAGSVTVSGIPYNMISNQYQAISGVAGNGAATLIASTTTGNVFLRAN